MAERRLRDADIELAIRTHLAAHPRAVDAVQGVQQWWLMDLGTLCSESTVQSALDRLVAAHVVERRKLPDGRMAYSAGSEPDSQS